VVSGQWPVVSGQWSVFSGQWENTSQPCGWSESANLHGAKRLLATGH